MYHKTAEENGTMKAMGSTTFTPREANGTVDVTVTIEETPAPTPTGTPQPTPSPEKPTLRTTLTGPNNAKKAAAAKAVTLTDTVKYSGLKTDVSYMLSGELEGQVLLETDKKEEVTLYLNGVELTSEKAYAIASVKGKTVNVILPAGTENTLTVRGVADDDNAQTEEEEADAAIYVKNDLVVSGSGALKITSAGKGIHAKDTLTLADGTIDITSADDAFNGKDGITVDSGIFTVTITDKVTTAGIVWYHIETASRRQAWITAQNVEII